MLLFLLFLLACSGATQILVYGAIFNKIRPTNKFFHCPMCMGFHVGWVMVLIFQSIFGLWFAWPIELAVLFVFSCISSSFSYTVAMMNMYLERIAHGQK